MLGSPAGPGGPPQRGLWPLAPAPVSSTTSFSADGISKYGVYSLFPGGPTFGSALYQHSSIGRFASGHIQQTAGNAFHTAHKVSDSLFSTTGYTFGAPTPPPGSPYSPIPVAQLELLTKGFTNSNFIIQQSSDFSSSPKKVQITERRCDERCCSQRTQKSCHCPGSPTKAKIQELPNGCSRTNPIEWNCVHVKKEPGTPCQVAEITTSALSPVVKLEVTSPTQKHCDQGGLVSNAIVTANASHIPVGITMARHRVQHEVIASPSLPPGGLLATVGPAGAQIKEMDNTSTLASMAAAQAASGAAQGGGAVFQCTDERQSGLAAFQMGGNMATPTLWQYPAPVPMESMVPLSVPTVPPGGFQLVRDPTTGGLLLLPTAGIEPAVQQTVVWPSYPQHSSVLLPSISSIPPPPLQLLSSASSDYLASSTTLHQHTQTHSTRLVAVTTDTKRKNIPISVPTTTFIKIETDGTLDQTKTLQAVSTIANNSGSVFTEQPMVTAHVIYQHPTNLNNIILSQTPANTTTEASCRSQATSPVNTCLTPPPDGIQITEEIVELQTTQADASNQTDTPICSEDDATNQESDILQDKVKDNFEEAVPSALEIQEPLETTQDSTISIVEPEKVDETISAEEVVSTTTIESNLEPVEQRLSEQNVKNNPDLSGLELLSNSIVEFETCRGSTEERLPDQEDTESTENNSNARSEQSDVSKGSKQVEDLGGLDLLCALAEQRIKEENIIKPTKHKDKYKDKERRRREKRKSKKHSLDEPKRKKMKKERYSSEDRELRKKEKKNLSEKSDEEKCLCKYKYKSYKSEESEKEVKKFLASKCQNSCCSGEWPCMNAMDMRTLDMRIKLAELQKEYREKQKELSKLKPRKHSHSSDCPKRKSRKKSTHSERSTYSEKSITPPPESEMIAEVKSEIVNESIRQLEEITSDGEKQCPSSQKRKVGRPKKLESHLGDSVTTETIVAKKPKNNFVDFLTAAKQKVGETKEVAECRSCTPPRYTEETYTHKLKKVKNNNTINNIEEVKYSNIRPKLRAEATVKTYIDDDDNKDIDEDIEKDEPMSIEEERRTELIECVQERLEPVNELNEPKTEEISEQPNPCTLSYDHLEIDKLRVLTAMGGLFYAGLLSPVEPPDVYSITLHGERGNRPHIMSREEIMRDAIVEVSPKSTEELPPGTRLCAYWSQQYRCLYPGTAAEPGTPDPHLDGKFVSVEFDDGDSGRIALEDIRLLPPNYPIIEYDPNPLLSLCKRRRRTSTSVSDSSKPNTTQHFEIKQEKTEEVKCKPEIILDHHKEKKRLKKKKKDKLKLKRKLEGELDEKKKKKKHKCIDEYCKHKKHHKKHKKHKRKHNKDVERNTDNSLQTSTTTDTDKTDTSQNIDGSTEYVNTSDDIINQSEIIENPEDEASKEASDDNFFDNDAIANPDDEVTMDDIIEAEKDKTSKKIRDRQESCESRSKMSAFLPARQLWHWSGKGYKRQRAKGKSKKCFYKTIQRGKEAITVGDSAVFLSTGRPDRPYIGKIEAMWELCGTMVVKVKWFYHPEETVGCPTNLQYPGALFESPHIDENDVQTISHKCEVLPLAQYTSRLGDDPRRYATIYDNNDIYYLAGYYDPTTATLKMEPGIPFT